MDTHVLFDEAHFTVPASHTPFAAQILQLHGYSDFNNEFQLGKFVSSTKLQITCMNSDVISPTESSSQSIGLDVFHSTVSICIPQLDFKVVGDHFQLKDCQSSTTAVRIQRWYSTLRNYFFVAIDGVNILHIDDIMRLILEARKNEKTTVSCKFSIMELFHYTFNYVNLSCITTNSILSLHIFLI